MHKTISNFTGGRLANQLYYILNAFVRTKQTGIKHLYTMTNTVNRATNMLEYGDSLNLREWLTPDNNHIDVMQPLNAYYQEFNIDFTSRDLHEFIQQTLLHAPLIQKHYTENKDSDDVVAIHIRNGDYKSLPMYHCFDKVTYLKTAFSHLPRNITKAIVFGDENELTKKEYGKLLSENFSCVEYPPSDQSNPLDDFCSLCTFQNKIMWNSTFSWWTGFVADELYQDKGIRICPINCWNNITSYSRTKESWVHL